ncbi:dihydrofolate reductase family protein [Agilicoccus flavus]|uniref:dihydrofolate reductase family protein n=1 Tax=Agilicoccus flavus TaxID=2775968 RepID=UPI001CF668C0|nr:dihydrofolate reductase family protein [Agilicoccus flavus]
MTDPEDGRLRLLLDATGVLEGRPPGPGDGLVDDATLARLYAYPPGAGSVVRSNLVSSLDGAAAGPDGLTGSINTAADRRVFALLRALADVIVVGAGTVRAEGYGPVAPDPTWAALRDGRPAAAALAVVTASGRVPERLLQAGEASRRDRPDRGGGGDVLVATTSDAPDLPALRERLGQDAVLVAGRGRVDPSTLVDALAERGLRRVLCEGGPTLAGAFVAADRLDEWCATLVPRLVGAEPRLLVGPPTDLDLDLATLLLGDGCLVGRWHRRRGRNPGTA